MKPARVVLVEDEADIAEAVSYQLGKAGLQVRVARTGAHIRRLRVKLGEARRHVETVVGIGYRFVSEPRAGKIGPREADPSGIVTQ